MLKIKKNLNEILLAYYIFSYIMLGRIIPNYTNISTNVLLINLIIIILISFLHNKLKMKFTIQELLLYIIIIIYAMIDSAFRFNQYTTQTYMYMVIFAIVPIYLYSRIQNVDFFCKSYSFFAVLVSLMFITDPLNGYKYTGDYMGFGYGVMLIAYIGLYIQMRNKGNIFLKILVLIVLIELMVYSNKGAILSAGIFTLLYEIFIKTNKLKNLVIISLGILILLNYNVIIGKMYDVAIDKGIDSYSLTTLYQMSNKKSTGLAGRDRIWNDAIEQIKEHSLFGNGAGTYRATHGGLYTHNIIFDVLIEYGIIILILFCIVVFKGLIKIKKSTGKERVLGCMFLVMWFPMLIFSSYFQSNMGFWLFLIWAIVDRKQLIKGEEGND